MGRETAPPEGEEDMEKTVEQETAKTFQRTRMVVMAAAFAALACVATMVVKVPSPTGGYMNLGDTVVLLGGYLPKISSTMLLNIGSVVWITVGSTK